MDTQLPTEVFKVNAAVDAPDIRNISSIEYCSTRGASSSRCVITLADIEAYSS
jgi:hypothetical protein